MSVEEKNAAFVDDKAGSVDREALTVPTSSEEFKFPHTPEQERRLVRKLDWRIMPIACIMYLFACECLLPS